MAATSSQTSHIGKYDRQNYFLWKLGLWVLLEVHNLSDIVTGEDTLPDEEKDDDGDIESEEEIKEWKVKDCRARGYILSTTEIRQQRILVDCKSAHQMWLALSAQHLEQAQDNLYDLQARFYEYQQKAGNDMKLHIAEIKSLSNHLEVVSRPVEERELITKIVCTLLSAYRPFVSSWRHSQVERQNLVTITSLLLQEEREIAKWVPKTDNGKDSAFQTQQSSSGSTMSGGHNHNE